MEASGDKQRIRQFRQKHGHPHGKTKSASLLLASSFVTTLKTKTGRRQLLNDGPVLESEARKPTWVSRRRRQWRALVRKPTWV